MRQATLENPSPFQSRDAITYKEFLNWDSENQHVEWVNGRVIPMPPISDGHQDVAGLLSAAMRAFVETHKLGVILFDPFQMKTGPDLRDGHPIFFLWLAHT
jgi:Uma2 family endonuclease